MIRRALLVASVAPFAVVACGESAPEPITPVALATPSASAPGPAESAAPAAPAAAAKPKREGGEATDDPDAAKGNMQGEAVGDSFGAGGLGLSGTGGSGGRGEGIGGIAGIGGRIGSGGGTTSNGQGLGNGRLGSGSGDTPPTLRQGSTTVSGRLAPEVIQRVVRQNYGRFRLCYENGLRANPTLMGKVVARYTIDATGKTVDVKDGGSTLADAAVVQCVLRGFGNFVYPKPDGGVVVVSYPILFEPGTPAPAAAGSAAPAGSAPPAKSGGPPSTKP